MLDIISKLDVVYLYDNTERESRIIFSNCPGIEKIAMDYFKIHPLNQKTVGDFCKEINFAGYVIQVW